MHDIVTEILSLTNIGNIDMRIDFDKKIIQCDLAMLHLTQYNFCGQF
jgi:hypothetical protein